jgi:competence protein ComEC
VCKSILLPFLIAVMLSFTGCTAKVTQSSNAGNEHNNAANETTQSASTNAINQNVLRVLFLDVGQGASQLLISPSGKTMLIDAGNNDKEQLMIDYMKRYNIKKLDIVIGTHPDADHIGGLDKVIDNLEIGKVYLPKEQSNTKTFESLLLSIKNKGLKVTTAKSGLTLDWDSNVKVNMIAPVKTYDDSNDMSAVVHVSFGKTSFMLTGDAETKSEKDILASGVDLKSDVLLVGHHGSNSSTSSEFLKKVNPKNAIIQVGKDNRYGHPTDMILDRLSKQGAKVFRNDINGTIEVTSNGENIEVKAER